MRTCWASCVVWVAGKTKTGNSTLVNLAAGLSGDNGEYGGVAVSSGRDSNKDGVLDTSEVTSTQFVCNADATVRCAPGDTIHDGPVVIRNDAEFAQLDGITCVDGDLIISGLAGEIPALSDLRTVTRDVVIAGNSNVTSLDGFVALRRIGHSYLIQGNDALNDVSSLAELDDAMSISLVGNDSLANLDGFSTLNTLKHYLSVSNNSSLTSLHGLDNVFTVRSGLSIVGNSSLTDLTALTNMRSAGILEISSNATLPAISLPNLQTVDVRLVLRDNPSITSVSVPQLVTLADGINVNGNPQLTSVSMPSLLTTGIITFENDTLLSTIDMSSLAYVTSGLTFTNLRGLTATNFSSLKAVGGTLTVYGVSPFSFEGFGSLGAIGGLFLVGTGNLSDFSGLDVLARVGGNMNVTGCPQLTSFGGLTSMAEVGGNLVISNNQALPTIEAQNFANNVTVHGTVTIQ